MAPLPVDGSRPSQAINQPVAYYQALVNGQAAAIEYSTGTGQLAVLNQDGSVNSAANPAGPGTAVALFATGLGAMAPLPVDGSRPSQAINQPVAYYQALVNGQAAAIEYIGNAPTLVEGVVQINIRLPDPVAMPVPTPGVAGISIYTGNWVGTFGSIAVR